jgi:hypothetical protein
MPIHFSLPDDPPKRNIILSVRLTPDEHTTISEFANRVQRPVSTLVRHFVLQAIDHHTPGSEPAETTHEAENSV